MAQPATPIPALESPPRAAPLGFALTGRADSEGPANRVLAELTLALNSEDGIADRWKAGQSLRFIVVSCGLFWLTAAVALYTLH